MRRYHEWTAGTGSFVICLVLTASTGLACLAVPGIARAQTGPPAIDLQAARTYFDEIRAVSDRDGGRLWGVPLFGPTLFVDRGTRQVVASHPDAEGFLSREEDLFTGTLPAGVSIANASLDWAGVRWTMLQWPLPRGRYARAGLLAHESFHRIQPLIGMPMSSPANDHLDTLQGRILLRLEWRALQDALSHTGPERMRHLEAALIFRARRHALFSAAAEEERLLLLNEGLAEFTGIAAAIPEGMRSGWAARKLDDYDGRALDGPLTRSFAYASGPAYGLLLEDLAPGWRSGVDPQFALGGTLAARAGTRVPGPQELEATADRMGSAYGGDLLVREETVREEDRREREAEYRARFLEGPTLTVEGISAFN